MLSFVRRNELFDGRASIRPTPVEGGSLPAGVPDSWDRIPPAIRGTPGDLLARATEGSVRLDSVGLAQDTERLYVTVRLRRAAIREAQYRVLTTLFYQDGHTARLRLQFKAPQTLIGLQSPARELPLPPGASARSSGRRINIVLPLAGMGHPVSLLMHVEIMGPLGTPVERSPWALVHLEALDGGHARQISSPRGVVAASSGGVESDGGPRSLSQ